MIDKLETLGELLFGEDPLVSDFDDINQVAWELWHKVLLQARYLAENPDACHACEDLGSKHTCGYAKYGG